MATIHDSGRPRSQCFTGTFVLRPTGLIGATLGMLVTDVGAITVRQVPGPNNIGPSLSDVDGQQVRLCGSFITDMSGTIFSVTTVQPLLLGSQ